MIFLRCRSIIPGDEIRIVRTKVQPDAQLNQMVRSYAYKTARKCTLHRAFFQYSEIQEVCVPVRYYFVK